MNFRNIVWGGAVALAVVASASAWERKPLPAFSVTTVEGAAVESTSLAAPGTWLLVHVQPRCTPCDTLLAHIGSDERAVADRITVIGSGMDGAAMETLAAKYPELAASRWLADPERRSAAALGIEAGPTVFGLRQRMIEWRLAGSVRGERELESMLFTWLEKR